MTDKNPLEAINDFFKLKDTYETSYYEKYVKPIIKSNSKSKKEKRIEFSKLPKHECINCKRNVGTIFTIKLNTDDMHKNYIAKCGDLEDPCLLDINITYGYRLPYDIDIKEIESEINNNKIDIIKEKNNIIFGYSQESNAIEIFNKLNDELKANAKTAGIIIEKNILINDNPEKKLYTKKLQDEFGIEFLMPFKKMIKDYNETDNTSIVNEAVKFYIEEMMPKIKEIAELKYEVNYVEYNDEDGKYKLIQMKNSLANLENEIFMDDKVVYFVKGTKKSSKSKNKTIKIMSPEKIKKKKTLKSRPAIDFEIEESPNMAQTEGQTEADVEAEMEAEAEEEKENISDNGYKNVNGKIEWNNPKYNKIWNELNDKYKSIIMQDPIWMQESMDEFYNISSNISSNNNKFRPREFVNPSNLKIPPRVLPNNNLDFENELYNNLFSKLEPLQKQIAISFLPKRETNDPAEYKAFISSLKSMMSNLTDFNAY
jgi:hypothetical protein